MMLSCRNCSSCHRTLTKDCYSNRQWAKGIGRSRCSSCVSGGRSSTVTKTDSARLNHSTRASFTGHDLDHPFAQGSFRWVAKGHYTEGERSGEACVCKWFKTGGVLEESFYETDLKIVKEALNLVTRWNSCGFVNNMVRINQPEVWTFGHNGRQDFAGRNILQEPFIPNYQKFNSNTGWKDDSTPWPRVMQALSHFSFHASNGTMVLCDLQGGVFSDGVVLTDPVIMSVSRSFGPTDLGGKGIQSFFANHKCNEFCRSDWKRVRNPGLFYSPYKGTSMEYVPPR